MTLCFDGCRLVIESRQLLRGSTEVHLSPKAFDVLRLLIDHRPTALSKTQILSEIWADTFVSEASLSVVIAEIRGALGDSARRPKLIRTVHRFGYAFTGRVVEERPADGTMAATCWLTCAGRDFPLFDGENVIGRDTASRVRLDSPRVSRRHARIVIAGGQATVEDAGSTNGTRLGGVRLDGAASIRDGEAIQIDAFQLVFHVVHAGAITDTAAQSRSGIRSGTGV